MWDIQSAQPMMALTGHKDGMQSVALSPDGKFAVTTSLDGSALMWRIFPTTEDAVEYARARVPRCLTPEERKSRFLPDKPPEWCESKWPYRKQ
jgi:WD40 repeat protein